MNLNTNQLMTAGAVAFAGFALWYVFRRPTGGMVPTQPGQAQRDGGLTNWLGGLNAQYNDLGRLDYSLNPDTFGDLLGATPEKVRASTTGTTMPTRSLSL